MVLADILSNVDKETSNCSSCEKADPVEVDVNYHARVFGAVVPIRCDFEFAEADLIMKHSIAPAVPWRVKVAETGRTQLGLRQFLQTPAIVRMDVRVC